MTKLLQQLTPNEYVASVYDIDLDQLWAMGKRLILTDLDNTLVPWNHPAVPSTLRAWLDKAKQRGFEVCIVSNNKGTRVHAFSGLAGIHAIGSAKKPKPHGYQTALKQFDVAVTEAVMVGDQLFTDIRGGNLCGIYTILVLPINQMEWWGTKITRQAEKIAMRRLVRSGLKVPLRTATEGEGE